MRIHGLDESVFSSFVRIERNRQAETMALQIRNKKPTRRYSTSDIISIASGNSSGSANKIGGENNPVPRKRSASVCLAPSDVRNVISQLRSQLSEYYF